MAKIYSEEWLLEKLKQTRAKKREEDARRERIVGQALLKALAAGDVTETEYTRLVDTFVTAKRDRALLSLSIPTESTVADEDTRAGGVERPVIFPPPPEDTPAAPLRSAAQNIAQPAEPPEDRNADTDYF